MKMSRLSQLIQKKMSRFQRIRGLGGAQFFLVSLTLLFGLSACYKKRPEQGVSSTQQSSSAIYPHPREWASGHVSYFAQAASLQGPAKNCGGCHDSLPKGRVLSSSISCAMNCHLRHTDEPSSGQGTSTGSVLPSSLGGASQQPPQNHECMTCHSGMGVRQQTHYPYSRGLCRSCHDVAASHMDGTSRGGASVDRSAQSCYRCHFQKDNMPHSHQALSTSKNCVNCHDPHGSSHKNLITRPVKDLCLSCHSNTPHSGRSAHGFIESSEKSCISCHQPHGSEHGSLLVQSSRPLCLSCHDQDIEVTEGHLTRRIPNIKSKVVPPSISHAPAAEANCTSQCHKPHASSFPSLLTRDYSKSTYNRYTETSEVYSLCFSCHNRSLLNQNIIGNETSFRNDTQLGTRVERKNLHWFHVVNAAGGTNKDFGRSCIVCHDPHGSSQGHSIRSSFKMGQFDIGLSYTRQPEGGQCTRTCHGPRTYRRIGVQQGH